MYTSSMIEMWAQCARFNTSQRLIDKASLILKKGWFSGLDMQEIFIVNREVCLYPTYRTETLNTEKQEPSNEIETKL